MEPKVPSNKWSGFHKKPIQKRLEILSDHFPKLDFSVLQRDENAKGLNSQTANLMIENCVGTISLPIGICPYLVLNNHPHVVPMAIEEPSVIAACCSAAKLIASCGGFKGESSGNVMTGQISLHDFKSVGDAQHAADLLNSSKKDILSHAEKHCENMVKRGGGPTDFSAKVITAINQTFYLMAFLDVDVCDCMGANIVNTVCEELAPYLTRKIGGRAGLRILTNLCRKRTSKVSFDVPFDKLGWKGSEGSLVAERILEAYEIGCSDIYRAVTNNKGVMNGIDAVAVATGQDWRAIESAAHSHAATKREGTYSPLVHYSSAVINGEKRLCGEIEMPISVGVVGGATKTHPLYKFALQLLGSPSAQTLSQILLAVGMASNFAAIRALVVEGIQKGHMGLHAKNIARMAGVKLGDIDDAVKYMKMKNKNRSEKQLY